MVGAGWQMLLECLSVGRSISLSACGTANVVVSTITSSAYSMIREQFNSPIGYFEGIEEKLASMDGFTYLANATRQFTVSAVDLGVKPSISSAISKYHLTEIGRIVLNHAMGTQCWARYYYWAQQLLSNSLPGHTNWYND